MKKYCNLFVLFCVVLIIPVLCHASEWDLDADGDVDGKDLYLLTGAFSSDYLEPFAAVFGSVEVTCGAYVAPGVWKEFDCYNLAAIGKDLGHNPFIPSWSLIGGYWQWGRKGPDPNEIDWHNTNTSNFAHGPTGPSAEEANEGEISSWDSSHARDGAWSESYKTSNDPCPIGFRVPTHSQWQGVLDNNIQSNVGTWSSTWDDLTYYSAARFFGNNLMLPAAGFRYSGMGSLGVSSVGNYWSSLGVGITSSNAYALYFDQDRASSRTSNERHRGLSIRCVAQDSTSLYLDKTRITLNAGESETVIIRGGTGYYTASSDNEQVAIVQMFNDSLEITSLSTGSATITVEDSSGRTAFIFVRVGSDWGNCGAYVAPDVWKEFDCYNLAAIGKITGANPFVPSWELIGGYWQWGRKGPDPDETDWHNTNTPNFAHGPTGPSAEEANEGEISGWATTYAPDGAWTDSYKTANDPCTNGFRVPTRSEWDGVLDNNPQSTMGTWSSTWDDLTNYSSAWFFGDDLMLPAAGDRNTFSGALESRGSGGYYWSTSEDSGTNNAWNLFLVGNGSTFTYTLSQHYGFSVRCIADTQDPSCTYEISSSSGSFPSGGGSDTVTLTTSSPDCSWSTAISQTWISLSPTSGTGSQSFTITVDANTEEARSGSVTIAGETYEISQEGIPEVTCGAYVAPGVWKEFDCYNLAAIGKDLGHNPFVPSWSLIGGYWQWGRKGPDPNEIDWHNTNTSNFAHGPTGPSAEEANEGSISGWDTSYAPDEAWSESYKTSNDPCPAGYRVPTESQWDGVLINNNQSIVGNTWSSSPTNYNSARKFGDDLMLPAAGYRYDYTIGALGDRGYLGLYWSSSEGSGNSAWGLGFDGGFAGAGGGSRQSGFSVRCVAE